MLGIINFINNRRYFIINVDVNHIFRRLGGFGTHVRNNLFSLPFNDDSVPSATAEFRVSIPTLSKPMAVIYVWSPILPVESVMPTTSSGLMCWMIGLRVNGRVLCHSAVSS